MSRIFLVILVLLAMSLATSAWGRRTTRHKLKAPDAKVEIPMAACVDSGMITIGKYDKPLRSRYESVFVTNNTDSTVTALRLLIRYISLQGDTMHQATRVLNCDLPPHSTRRITFSSWDKQMTLYYHLTDKPSRLSGTPYKVDITPIGISVSPAP